MAIGPGRLDLQKMMGTPDDPARAEAYRRGSPVYRAERIEAPLLILHGRKDKRVVPLMTERMVEALEIEGKIHEVHWYDDEGHGWERRENRRDAFERILRVPADPHAARTRSRHGLAAGLVAPSPGRVIGMTLMVPSVSRTASCTSSTRARPWRRTAARTSSTSTPSSRSAFVEDAAVAHEQPRFALDGTAEPSRRLGERLEREVEAEQGDDRDEPAPDRHVLADHRVLDRVADDEDDDELEDGHLPDLALARDADDGDQEQVDDGGPDDHVGEARADLGQRRHRPRA